MSSIPSWKKNPHMYTANFCCLPFHPFIVYWFWMRECSILINPIKGSRLTSWLAPKIHVSNTSRALQQVFVNSYCPHSSTATVAAGIKNESAAKVPLTFFTSKGGKKDMQEVKMYWIREHSCGAKRACWHYIFSAYVLLSVP